jgi:hypothetical protein
MVVPVVSGKAPVHARGRTHMHIRVVCTFTSFHCEAIKRDQHPNTLTMCADGKPFDSCNTEGVEYRHVTVFNPLFVTINTAGMNVQYYG